MGGWVGVGGVLILPAGVGIGRKKKHRMGLPRFLSLKGCHRTIAFHGMAGLGTHTYTV